MFMSWHGFPPILTSVVMVMCFSSSVLGDDPAKKDLSAKEILDRVVKTYANCETYRDSGEVSITFIMKTEKRIDIRPFTTAFIRPDRFRYQYQASNPANKVSRYLIWRKGEEVRSWWDITPGVQKPQTLGFAMGAAAGVSGGSSVTVPGLLIPKEVGGSRLLVLTELKRGDDETLNGTDCYRVEGISFKTPLTLLIEKKTFLLRRLTEFNEFGEFQTEQTTTYKPTIGEKIPEEALVFDPPKPIDD